MTTPASDQIGETLALRNAITWLLSCIFKSVRTVAIQMISKYFLNRISALATPHTSHWSIVNDEALSLADTDK